MSDRSQKYIKTVMARNTTKQAAKRLGVSERTIRRWKSGETKNPKPENLKRLQKSYAGYRGVITKHLRNPDKITQKGGSIDSFNVQGMTVDEITDFIMQQQENDPDAAFRVISTMKPTPDYPRGKTGTGWFQMTNIDNIRKEVQSRGTTPIHVFKTT